MQATKKYRMAQRQRDWRSFIDDYKNPAVRSSTFDLSEHYGGQEVEISSHFLMDSFLMHFKPWQELVFNPLTTNTWKSILEKEFADDKYKALNTKTSRNPLMAQLAARNLIDGVVKVAKKSMKAIPDNVMQQAQQQQGSQPSQQGAQQGQPQTPGNQPGNQQGNQSGKQGQSQSQGFNFNTFMGALQMMGNGNAGNRQVANQITASLGAAMQGATQISESMMDLTNTFSHSGIPMRRLMDPDEMRDVLSNRLVIDLARAMKKLATDDTGKSTTKPSPRRGLPLGVKTMSSYREIPDIIPLEHLYDPDLHAYRVISRKAQVIERYASMNRYLVYVDKSGSMGGTIGFGNMQVSKLAGACACALGLANTLRMNGGEMILKLFDVEVQEPVSDMWEILKTLAKVDADSGTNVTKVLDDIKVHGRDYKSVIISDGIDRIEESAARAVKDMDVNSVLIREKNPILEKYTKVTEIKRFDGDNILLEL